MTLDFTSRGLRVAIRDHALADPPDWPRYVVHNPENNSAWFVFGFIQGGDTREEVLFWAERLASKNGLPFERPEDWENVVSELPETSHWEKST